MWRNSNTPQPKCHEHKKLTKMLVVKDIFKPSFGQPFFVCSNKEKPCSFWQWGDVIRPQCYHGAQCSTRKVKKDGANYVRLFYTCSKGKDDSCGYFEWRDKKEDKDPFEPFSTVYFSNLLRMGIRLRRLAKISQAVMRIASKLTKNTCPLKQRKRTCKTGYANYV